MLFGKRSQSKNLSKSKRVGSKDKFNEHVDSLQDFTRCSICFETY